MKFYPISLFCCVLFASHLMQFTVMHTVNTCHNCNICFSYKSAVTKFSRFYLASFILQNTAANGRKTAGNRKNMILSKRLSSASVRKSFRKHSCIFSIDPFLSKLVAFAFRASNNVLCDKIQAYSKMAKMMKIRQEMIHWIMALALPPDLGDVLCVEFNVLTIQRNMVSKRPSLPGMASLGTRKLT